jgi:small GTP-binding protein
MSASSSPTENRLRPGRAARSRSVALVGPYGSGKSTLYESLMAAAGAPVRRAGEQRARAMTTEMTLGHCEYLGDRWSLVDCPGSVEFAAETAAALSIVDLAIIVCEPVPERALTLAPLFKILEDRAIPHLVFINKIDTLQIRVRDTLAALQADSRAECGHRLCRCRERAGLSLSQGPGIRTDSVALGPSAARGRGAGQPDRGAGRS